MKDETTLRTLTRKRAHDEVREHFITHPRARQSVMLLTTWQVSALIDAVAEALFEAIVVGLFDNDAAYASKESSEVYDTLYWELEHGYVVVPNWDSIGNELVAYASDLLAPLGLIGMLYKLIDIELGAIE